MKIRCIKLFDANGQSVESSDWLVLGRVYHVMSFYIDECGERYYGIINFEQEGEWPQLGSHSEKCFEVVSAVIPSNWSSWTRGGASGMAPTSWQAPGFYESFYDHDRVAYPIFEKEKNNILKEDP